VGSGGFLLLLTGPLDEDGWMGKAVESIVGAER